MSSREPSRPTGGAARTYPLQVDLTMEEWLALRQFRDEEAKGATSADIGRLLIRDALIGLGILDMGRANRGKRAGR